MPSRSRRRAIGVVAGVGAATVVIAATWGLANVFQSPEQREAGALPPAPEPVFAKVTTGVLAESRSYAGTVLHGDEAALTLPGGADAVRRVVTDKPPAVGSALHSGDLLTEVNTRPVFVVASPFGFFRDIGFGDTGADVRVLQDALADHGYSVDVDGRYGAQTSAAVSRWYRDAGYDAPMRERTQTADTPTTDTQTTDTQANTSTSSTGADTTSSAPASKPVLDAYVPVSELLAVAIVPAIVVAAPTIGSNVAGETPDLTLGSDQVIVRAEVPAPDAAALTVDDPVTIETGDDHLDGKVAGIEAQPDADDGTATPSILTAVFTTPPSAQVAARGTSVTVDVQNAVVPGPSLIVPTAAVVARGDGRGVVVSRRVDGTLAEVPVTVRGSLRGMTAISADDAGALAEGDDVRVG